MSSLQKLIVTCITFPLLLLYGYVVPSSRRPQASADVVAVPIRSAVLRMRGECPPGSAAVGGPLPWARVVTADPISTPYGRPARIGSVRPPAT